MALALGHPTLGYYRGDDPLGAAGDFVTAPEISQMFGEIVGLWLAQAWSDLGRPAPGPPGRARPRPRHADRRPVARDRARRRAFARRSRSTWSRRSPACAAARPSASRASTPSWHERFERGPAGTAAAGRQRVPRRAAGPSAGAHRADGWRERAVGLGRRAPPGFVLDERPSPLPGRSRRWRRAPPGTVAEVSPARAALARADRRAASRPRAGWRC